MTLPGLAAADCEAHTPLPVACSIKLRLGVRKPSSKVEKATGGRGDAGTIIILRCLVGPIRGLRAPLPDRARLQSRGRGGGGLAGP
jgi:hypothetical protein